MSHKTHCFSTSTYCLLFASLLFGTPVMAEKEKDLEVPPPPPEILEQEKDHLPPPEITIIKRDKMTIEEYRVNGRLRYAKITPVGGKPYYMVDTDGDGDLDTKHHDLNNPPPVQQWILHQW